MKKYLYPLFYSLICADLFKTGFNLSPVTYTWEVPRLTFVAVYSVLGLTAFVVASAATVYEDVISDAGSPRVNRLKTYSLGVVVLAITVNAVDAVYHLLN